MNRIITYSIIIGLCFFISYLSVNGTNIIAQRDSVRNISYKLPNNWNAVESEKQFRLLEITLKTNEDFSLVLFSNIQGTADQNIERWIGQFAKDELPNDSIIIQKDSLDNKSMIIHSEKIDKNILKNLIITVYDEEFRSDRSIIAKEAIITNKSWELKDGVITDSYGKKDIFKNYIFLTNFDYLRINSLFSNLESLNIIELFKQKNDLLQKNLKL